jgi:glycosyltransferase involved in cell wall biosynthesis
VKVGLHVGQLRQAVPGGIGRYVRGLLSGLQDLGVDTVPFGAGPLAAGELATVPGYVDLGPPTGSLRYELWHRLRHPVVRLPVDVIHAPSLAIPPTGPVPLVVTVHDVAFLRHPEAFTRHGVGFHRRGLALAYREAATVVTASTFARDELLRTGFDGDRIHVAPHGVDVPEPEADDVVATRIRRLGLPEQYVLAVGTVEPRKGLDVLAAAFSQARRAVPDLALAIVGPRGWLAVPGLDDPGIRVLGRVDERTLDALYRRAVLCAVPSRYEGFGLPALEAMARGCPVVASATTSLPEVVGDAGRLVPPEAVAGWADAIVELCTAAGPAAELARRGRARAAEFTWTRSARAHLDAYTAATGAGAHP